MDATLGVVNIVAQGAVLFYALRRERPGDRRLLYILSGLAALVTVAGLIWRYVGDGSAEIGGGLVWLLYILSGMAVLGGIVVVLRSGGATRFAWRRGRYQQWRKYKRVV